MHILDIRVCGYTTGREREAAGGVLHDAGAERASRRDAAAAQWAGGCADGAGPPGRGGPAGAGRTRARPELRRIACQRDPRGAPTRQAVGGIYICMFLEFSFSMTSV